MRGITGKTSSTSWAAAAAAAAWWLMGIASVLSSVAAESETPADRLPTNAERSTAPTADLPWPTAIVGQFLLLHSPPI